MQLAPNLTRLVYQDRHPTWKVFDTCYAPQFMIDGVVPWIKAPQMDSRLVFAELGSEKRQLLVRNLVTGKISSFLKVPNGLMHLPKFEMTPVLHKNLAVNTPYTPQVEEAGRATQLRNESALERITAWFKGEVTNTLQPQQQASKPPHTQKLAEPTRPPQATVSPDTINRFLQKVEPSPKQAAPTNDYPEWAQPDSIVAYSPGKGKPREFGKVIGLSSDRLIVSMQKSSGVAFRRYAKLEQLAPVPKASTRLPTTPAFTM